MTGRQRALQLPIAVEGIVYEGGRPWIRDTGICAGDVSFALGPEGLTDEQVLERMQSWNRPISRQFVSTGPFLSSSTGSSIGSSEHVRQATVCWMPICSCHASSSAITSTPTWVFQSA